MQEISRKKVYVKTINESGVIEKKHVKDIVKYVRPNNKIGVRTEYVQNPIFDAQQNTKDSCDINNIISKYAPEEVFRRTVIDMDDDKIVDVSNLPDYQTALNTIRDAEYQFSKMPINIKKRFRNSVKAYVDFVSNPDNIEEMYDMGLAIRPQEPTIKEEVNEEAPKEE